MSSLPRFSIFWLALVVTFIYSPVFASDTHQSRGKTNDGYAHHDKDSGKYDKKHDRWEWDGPHKSCNIKGRHFHDHGWGHDKPQGKLDCSNAVADPESLWPANHQFEKVEIDGLLTSDGHPAQITIQCVYQDEAVNGIGDGNTAKDAKLSNTGQLFLRKERSGHNNKKGNGRVYHVDFLAEDTAAGESCEGSVAVEVPHHRKGIAKDDGRLYVSLDNGYNCGSTNLSPVITSTPITSTTETIAYQYAIDAYDPEGSTLGYMLTSGPEGMQISSDGIIDWIPALGTGGSYSIAVTVFDDQEGSVDQSFTLTVNARENTAPQFTSSPILTAIEEQPYGYQLTALDAEGDNFAFSLTAGPMGMTLGVDGLLVWTPSKGEAGEYAVTVIVSDILGATSEQTFILVTAPKPNNSPEITSTPVISVNEGEVYTYTVLANDPEGSTLVYRLVDAPTAMQLVSNVISWSTNYVDSGEYRVAIEVEDVEGATATQAYTLTVIDVNRLPTFVSQPVVLIDENANYLYIPETTDQDGDLISLSLVSGPQGMILNDLMQLKWIPDYEAAGIYEVSLKAVDTKSGETFQNFTLTVANTNRDPQITSTPLLTNDENTPYSYQIVASDDDNDSLQYSLVTAPTGMTVNDQGLVSWLPDFSSAGEVAVEIAVSDGTIQITQAYTLTVTNVNRAPLVQDISASIEEEAALNIVLDATDEDGDSISFTLLTQPSNGVITGTTPNLTYQPNVNYSGTDSFTFKANDGSLDSDTATFSITVTPVNDAPIALDQNLSTDEDLSTNIQLIGTDNDGDFLTYLVISQPVHGQLSGVAPDLVYTPGADFYGVDSFTYVVNDGVSNSSVATINFTVTPVNDAPVMQNQNLSTDEDTSLAINLIATDIENDALSFVVMQQPVNGDLSGTAPNLIYQPDANFNGTDIFSVKANDGAADSNIVTYSIVVNGVNDVPVAIVQSVSTNEDIPVAITLVGSDIDGDVLSYIVQSQPLNGQLTGIAPNLTYTPSSDFNGSDSFAFTASDGVNSSTAAIISITVHPINDAPVLSSQLLSTTEDTSLALNLVASDPENDLLTYNILQYPLNGTLTGNAPNLVYTPNENFYGTDFISVVANDGINDSTVATIAITVNPANDNPVANTQAISTVEEAPVAIVLTGSDIDGDTLSYMVQSPPLNGQLTGIAPNLTYTPEDNFSGSDSFSFIVNDGITDSTAALISITVTPLNDPPVIADQMITVQEDSQVTVDVTATDIDGDTLTYLIVTQPANGTLTGVAPNLTYLPNANFNGTDSFTVTANDGVLDSNLATFTLTVLPQNDIPVADVQSIQTNEDTSVSITLTGSDADNDALTYQLASQPIHGVLSGVAPNLTYAPNINFDGVDSFTFTVNDGTAPSSAAAVSITVMDFNQSPVITSVPTDFVIQGDDWSYTLTASDQDNDLLTFTMAEAPAGVGFVGATGQATWSTVGLQPGSYAFTFEVNDSKGGIVQQSVAVEVLSTERSVTHEGTDFWIPVTLNMASPAMEAEGGGGTFDISLVSHGRDTTTTVEIPLLNQTVELTLLANQIQTHSINLDEYKDAGGYGMSTILQNRAIHISSPTPIAAYFINQKQASTDGFIGLPADSLGKEYIAGTYNMQGVLGQLKSVDGGQFGSIITIVAVEDNTQVTVNPIMDILPGDERQLEKATPLELVLNQGDVYNLETRGSFKADLTGSSITADKRIAVFGQIECVNVPINFKACDHLAEQLPPLDSLSTEYFTAPFWGRANADGRPYSYRESGDTFRVVAPYNDTVVTVNGVIRAHLHKGEFFEYVNYIPQHLQATHPVLLMQFSNGDVYDRPVPSRELPERYADPFMLVVPPAEQYLKRYTINTAARNMAYNYVNVIVPNGVVASLKVDGIALDPTAFHQIEGTGYSYVQHAITTGSHTLEADEAFGLYVYGYDWFETYGYLGGMALSTPDSVASLTLSANPSSSLDIAWCVESKVEDRFGRPVNGIRVKFNVSGVTNQDAYHFSNAFGIARYCYTAYQTGIDSVTASVLSLNQNVLAEWLPATQNLPPVITSVPPVTVSEGDSFTYDFNAVDPDGDVLTYEILDGPSGLTIDGLGQVHWPVAEFVFTEFNRKDISLRVTDSQGNHSEQHFMLREYVPFNTPPSFEPATPEASAWIGVPYVYNHDKTNISQTYLQYQIPLEDVDEDAAFVDIASGPQEAYIQRIHSYYTGISRPNEPRSCEGCTHYLRWIPQTTGQQSIELSLRDARGGQGQSKFFTVDVLPNEAPQILDFNPPGIASIGAKYEYLLNVQNDVPLYHFDNLDDLKVVFDQKPNGMGSDMVRIGNTQTLRVYWTANHLNQPGEYTIRLHVEDRLNSTPVEEFTLNLVSDNSPPVISGSMPSAEATIPYEYQIQAVDPEGGALTYSLIDGPAGMTVDTVTGVIRWVPDAIDSYSSEWVWYQVTDDAGLTSVKSHLLNINVFSNRAPTFVEVFRPSSAKIGVEFTHQLHAIDREGDLPITYKLSSSASGIMIDESTGQISWTPTTEGSYWISVSATDSLGHYNSNNRATWYVDVVPNTARLDASLVLNPATPVDLNDTVTLTVVPANAATSPQVSATVDGLTVTVDPLLQVQITADRVGRIPVEVTVSDGIETVTRSTVVVVRDPADTIPPVVQFHAPLHLSSVTAPTEIVATVQDDGLSQVFLGYKPANEPLSTSMNMNDFTVLYQGSAEFVNASMATFDPTQLMNGSYHILLQATDANNNSNGQVITVNVEGDLKVGIFNMTLEDLEIPLAGIPISVSRTYDSRRKNELLDFGYGWSVDYQNVRLQESDEPTNGWTQYSSPSETFKSGSSIWNSAAVCIDPAPEKTVTITLPNGDVEKFQVLARPTGDPLASLTNQNCYLTSFRYYDVYFVPEQGTHSTLTTSEATNLYLSDIDAGFLSIVGASDAQAVTNYTLTTREGYQYQINQDFGVEQITDPNGFTLTYGPNGIVHSSGKEITFVRDAQGRIEQIIDPAGQAYVYQYDVNGDLKSFQDPVMVANGSNWSYVYDQHFLTEIYDPMARRVLKNLFDTSGRLYAQEDINGVIKDYNHDIASRTSTVVDLDGRSTRYVYDDEGNVLSETKLITDGSYATDIVTSYTYDTNGNQTTKTIGASTWTDEYDAEDNLLWARDPENHQVDYLAYTPQGQERLIQDELGRVTEMVYDGAGNLTDILMPEVIDPDTGAVQQYSANNEIVGGLVQSTTDLRGMTTTYTYYSSATPWFGLKETESNSVSGTITYTYDDNNNVKTETRQRSVDGTLIDETVEYFYDAANRLTKTLYPDATYTETLYDPVGNIDQERDRFGVWTDYTYDGYGHLTDTFYANGSSEHRTYTREGLLETVTDRMGRITTYEYNDAGLQWKVHHPDNTYTETQYTPQGWVKYEWDEKRNLTEYEYDLAGQRSAVIHHLDGRQIRHQFGYYANGELESETDALLHTTSYVLNELDQRIETRYHDSSTTKQRFDAMGARIRSIDQRNVATDYRYDTLGRLWQVQPDVEIDLQRVPNTSYLYDEVGNKLTQTDANDHSTHWTYDYHGRVLTRTLPEGMSESFVYDDSLHTETHTDFKGQLTTTYYDDMGRIQRIEYSNDPAIVYTYWDNDQVRTVTDGNGVTEYNYDQRDRLDYQIQPDGTTLDYAYDDAGNRSEVKIIRGTETTLTSYSYDGLNRLETVTDANGITVYSYDDVGNLDTITYPNGIKYDYSYTTVNQLDLLTITNANGDIMESYDYGLDATGRRRSLTEADGRYSEYIYDDLYRLTNETITDAVNGNHSAAYQYDWVGNRSYSTVNGMQTSYQYDWNDRLLSQGGTTYTYDDNGNLQTETLDGNIRSYIYDDRNKLKTLLDNNIEVASYSYNHNGIRIGKTEGTSSTSFVVDENRDYAQVLQELENGTPMVDYSYGLDLISQNRGGEARFYQYDGLGSTRQLSDATGVITDSYDYEAFGDTLNQTGSTDNDYLFTGEQFDQGLDQYYLRARYYDPGIARFTQMDTWMGNSQDPISLHKYLYTHADPVNNIDPTGKFTLGGLMTGLNVAANLYTTASAAYDVFSSAEEGQGAVSGKDLGVALIVSRVAGAAKLLKNLAKKVCQKQKKICKVPILDTKHIFEGEIRKRTAKGFHSTAVLGTSNVLNVQWKNPNGVYKARVQVYDSKTGRYREKNSTMFPDSWGKARVGGTLYLAWIRNKAKKSGKVNFGVTSIQYYVTKNNLLQGFPTR